ncbi:MAG: biotin/lipoyl-binding protein [Chloroflexi bacterium]|nr:biotin/lipoyl-binding protein [Chloroflexota bacterium]
MRYVITVEGETFEIDVGREGRVWVNDRPYDVDFQGLDGRPECSLLVDHRSYEAHVEHLAQDECQVTMAGRPYRASLQQGGRSSSQDTVGSSNVADLGEVCAPLPGLLVAVSVTEGQHVMSGEVVAILESMKMNLELCAPRGGIVQSVHVTPGMDIGQGDVVLNVM